MTQLDKGSFRHAMSHFASGVTIMTTTVAGRMHGMTVSAFASQSLDPLLILVSVERSTTMHRLVIESRAFAINILGEQGEGTARFFADNARLDGPEFQEGAYHLGVTGSPLLEEATAYLEATLDATLEAGDHTVMVGRVVALNVVRDAAPLIYYRSGYRSLT
ncbi:MAG: flavin reductase family protein [Chloroflexi bacterium]|nr:MAG: flavin reductase family protein [Chloroflexota bacterium]